MTIDEVKKIYVDAMLGSAPTAAQAQAMAEALLDCADQIDQCVVTGSLEIEAFADWIAK